MDYKFIETNEKTRSQRICFLKKDDILSIETGQISNYAMRNASTEPGFIESIIIYTRSMSPITLMFDTPDKRDHFLQELTQDYNPKEFQISWRK